MDQKDLSHPSLLANAPSKTTAELQPESISQYNQFTLFPSLPAEIQQDIWDFACLAEEQQQRVLPIAPDNYEWFLKPRHAEWYHPAILVANNMPFCLKTALLHVCRYTRAKLSTVYVPWPCVDPERLAITDRRKIFVKPKKDLFFLTEQRHGSYWFLKITRLKLHSQNDDLPGLITADQSADAKVIYTIAHLAVDSELYKTFFNKVALWKPKFKDFEELWICRGNLKFLRKMGAGSMEVFLRLAAGTCGVDGPLFVPREGMRYRLRIRRNSNLVEADDLAGQDLRLRFVGKTTPVWIESMGELL